jgi:sugar lactone lactonase YvrE
MQVRQATVLAAMILTACLPYVPYVVGGNDAGSLDAGPADAGPVEVTTLAGNGTQGFADGTGGPYGIAEFDEPLGVAVDAQGNVYVADSSNYRIREIDLAGNVTTFAGRGTFGHVDGPSGTAEFQDPSGIAIDSHGNFYVADSAGNRIRKIDPSGNVTTLAGNGTGASTSTGGYADGTGGPNGSAEFYIPMGVAVDGQGNVYVADTWNNRVRKIDPVGNVTTLAGNGLQSYEDGTGGPNGTAEFYGPEGLAVDAQGNVYVADSANNRVRKIDTGGNVTTLAGNGTPGFADGTGGPNGTAEFLLPMGVAVDSQGNVVVADNASHRIRRIDPAGNVTTLAGNGMPSSVDGTGGANGSATFYYPWSVASDAAGNVYVADSGSSSIRRISWAGHCCRAGWLMRA